MNFRITTKNRAADPEIGFLTKSILKLYGPAAAMPTALANSGDGRRRVHTFDFSNEKDWSMSLAVYHFSEF